MSFLNKTPDFKIITDTSRMALMPPHSPIHWLFVLLMISATGCALWQHGHVWLTLGILFAAPVAASMVYIPYKIIGSMTRAILNGIFFALILIWGIWRVKTVLPDKVLVEALGAATLIFLSSGKSKHYFYLLFIGIFLMIYGALLPRLAYLYFAFPGLISLLLIAWFNRTAAFAGQPVQRETKQRIFRNLPFMAVQLILSGVFFWHIFFLMPTRNNELPGLFETSFLTERDTALPPEITHWLKPHKVKLSDHKKAKTETAAEQHKPQSESKDGKPMNLPESSSKAMIEGNGNSSSMGDELLFRVKSPVKLYHLVRLYDEYDGTSWRVSPQMKRLRIKFNYENQKIQTVEMRYTIVKLPSLKLPVGFAAENIFPIGDNLFNLSRIIRQQPYGGELLKKPELPFDYIAGVWITQNTPEQLLSEKIPPVVKGKKGRQLPDPMWTENLSQYHYKKLPVKKISGRVRKLASDLTKDCTSYYERAIRLRDHLRKNYTYTLQASPVPGDKEAADYFLFELRTGHCEYFACALAVLARAAGLSARVATGFAPGNYNTLNNLFEVHENHAHAWTQIYIPKAGWLTMDAVPPGNMQEEVIPKGIGYLRDPFGEEWKITPPELTQKTTQFLKEQMQKKKILTQNKMNAVDSTLIQVVKTQEKLEKNFQEQYEKTTLKIEKSQKKGGWLYKLQQIKNKIIDYLIRLFFCIYDFVFTTWQLILFSILLFIALGYFLGTAVKEFQNRRRRIRMQRLIERAKQEAPLNPGQSVLDVYRAFRLALKLAGLDRKDTCELLTYSDQLGNISSQLGNIARTIFLLYYKSEHEGIVTLPDAETAMSEWKKALQFLQQKIR